MKLKYLISVIIAIIFCSSIFSLTAVAATEHDSLLYMGHASLRIVTSEGKVIYVDPFAGDGYDFAANLILVTHDHYDHNAVELVANRAPDCKIITWEDVLPKESIRHLTWGM